MEKHFHSAGRIFQGYSDLIDVLVTLLCYYGEKECILRMTKMLSC